MTFGTRLLPGGAGSFVIPPPSPPPPTVESITSASNGGNNPWTIAGAIQASGDVFIGYVDGASGNVEIVQRAEVGGAVTGPTTIKASMEADAHDSPALLIRSSDSKIVAIYGPHNAANIYRRISTNALDSTSWGTETNLDSSLGGTRYTDWQLHQLNSEASDPIYLFFRNEPTAGTDSRWQLSKSTDGGSTFGAMANIYHIPSNRSYLVSWSNGADRIDFLATAAFSTSPYKIGHFYYEGGSYFKSDGTSAGSPPIQTFANITQLYSGTDLVQPGQVAYDGSGNPVVTFYTWNSTSKLYTYWYGRWNGSAWTVTAFVVNTPAYNYNAGAQDGVYGVSIDDADPDIVYGIKAVLGQPEWFRWITADGGATFTETQLSTGSTTWQGAVITVRNRGAALAAVGNHGTWNHYTSYSVGLNGVVDP